MSQLNNLQIALFQYLKSKGEQTTLFADERTDKAFIQILSSQSDDTKTATRFSHYFSVTFTSADNLALVQQKAEDLVSELRSIECPLNDFMTDTTVELVRNDGITINIEKIEEETFYTITCDLEITTEGAY